MNPGNEVGLCTCYACELRQQRRRNLVQVYAEGAISLKPLHARAGEGTY